MGTTEDDLRAEIAALQLMVRAMAEVLPPAGVARAVARARLDCTELAMRHRAGGLGVEAGRIARAMARLADDVTRFG
ncbi:hypothetical protein BKK80_34580 (plasmid) [Cupriavidus malaysiensis]|uniref:Uncharacterized protein n=1 Tax=Cupriavidus malaysiensis TaxID=367825 RepID=A0ABN4TVQ9_9BURK|nr:hypothetical protein BKK80_34580 [Cupriavidus malaysiensis]